MTNEQNKDEINPELWKWQIERLEGAFPNLHLNDSGRFVWFNEILNKNFKGSELIKAVDSLIEASTRGDNKVKFIILGDLLRMLYGIRNIVYKEERQKEQRKENLARDLSMDGILNGGRGKISEKNKLHIKATQDFLKGKTSRPEWERIKKEIEEAQDE